MLSLECNNVDYSPHPDELDLVEDVDNLIRITDVIEEEGLKYIAGYVASRFRTEFPTLGTPTEFLVDPRNDWIYQISKGKLVHPSDNLMSVARVMNYEFKIYHGSFF